MSEPGLSGTRVVPALGGRARGYDTRLEAAFEIEPPGQCKWAEWFGGECLEGKKKKSGEGKKGGGNWVGGNERRK